MQAWLHDLERQHRLQCLHSLGWMTVRRLRQSASEYGESQSLCDRAITKEVAFIVRSVCLLDLPVPTSLL
jgi:hypothetical protein